MGKIFKPIARATTGILTGGLSEAARIKVGNQPIFGTGAEQLAKSGSGVVQKVLFSPEAASFAAGVGISNASSIIPSSLSGAVKIPDFLKNFKIPDISIPESLRNISLGDLPNAPKGIQEEFTKLLTLLPLTAGLLQQRIPQTEPGRDFAIGDPTGGFARAGSFFGDSFPLLILIVAGVVIVVVFGKRRR